MSMEDWIIVLQLLSCFSLSFVLVLTLYEKLHR